MIGGSSMMTTTSPMTIAGPSVVDAMPFVMAGMSSMMISTGPDGVPATPLITPVYPMIAAA